MNFWSLNTRFYLTIENQWFLDENYQFETYGCESDEFLFFKHSFLPYDGKTMAS